SMMLSASNMPDGTTAAHWTFSGLLDDGNYEATLPAASVHDSASQPMMQDYVLPFYVLTGDANRDRKVDLTDFTFLASNFNQSPRDFSQGDFNYDSMVDLTDFTYLASRFNKTLNATAAEAATPLAASPAKTSSLFSASAVRD